MTNPEFVYTTYIKTTPQKVWDAITKPEFTRQYWGHDNVSDWKKGSKWEHVDSNDKKNVMVAGEVVESTPPKRLVLSWYSTSEPNDKSLVTFEIEQVEDMVRLNVIHGRLSSEMASKISVGWPRVLSSMKTFLETGKPLDMSSMKCGK